MTQQPRSTFVLRDHSEILGALVGLKDVVVLHYERRGPDVELAIEQLIRQPVRCPSCAEPAQVKERPLVTYVDLPVYGTPMRLGWKKHRMRCPNPRCTKRSWVLQRPPHRSQELSLDDAGGQVGDHAGGHRADGQRGGRRAGL